MGWILRLEDQRVLRDPAPVTPAEPPVRRRGARPLPGPPTPDLIPLLGDPEARIRRRAALAVGRVGLPDGVAPLRKRLQADAEPEVRQMAAFALGLIGDPAATEPLVAALSDSMPIVQGRAAEALGLIGAKEAAEAVGRMVARHAAAAARIGPEELSYPLDPEVEAFRLGVYALARLGQYEPLAAALIAPDGQPRVRWWPVAYALQRLRDRRATPALTTFARSEGIYGVAFGARGLGELKDPAAAASLLPLVDPKRDPRVVVSAVRAVAELGAREAGPAVLKIVLTREVDANVRREAVVALGRLGVGEATEALLDLLTHPWPAMRAAALGALAAVDQEMFVLVLSSRDPDPHWIVRAALADALARTDAKIAIPRLTVMLDDEDQRVIPAALSSLVALGAPEVSRMLFERLKVPDFGVRLRAAQLVGQLEPEGGASALADAYQRGLADNTYVARAAALDALARYGDAAARPTLSAALTDPDWAVRRKAAMLLSAMDPAGDYADAIRPAPTRLAPEGYNQPALVKPDVSPHVFIETARGVIQLELFVLDAPLTSHAFMELARAGFFNGLSIHRVVPNFVVQDGDPRGDGEGGPGFTIRDELNQQPYLRGTVGMALDWPDTGGSQFFITHGPAPHLDARYTAFGRVIAGIDVLDSLQQWDRIERVIVWDGQSFGGS